MKKWGILLLLAALLSGCAPAPTFETLGDVDMTPVMQPQSELSVAVPDAVSVGNEAGTLYLCDGYEVTVEVRPAGDLTATLRAVTGFGQGELTVMETASAGVSRFECVWTAAGEGGDTVGRTTVLDDGSYHYCVTATATAAAAAGLQDTWQAIFSSVRLS